MLQHDLPVWSGTGEQREHAHYCLVTMPAFHIYEQGSTCDWARERIDFPSCDPAQTCVCKGKNTVNTTFLPGLSQLASGCIPLKQHFSKEKLELGLKTSLPVFLCYKPLRQESMSLPISLQRHSMEQGHSKAESAQSCLKFFK